MSERSDEKGGQPDFAVHVIDDERKWIRSNDHIRLKQTYDYLYDLEKMVCGMGSSEDPQELHQMVDILAFPYREQLSHAWRNAQDAVGLCYSLLAEFEWHRQPATAAPVAEDVAARANNITINTQPSPPQKESAWVHLARGFENLTMRLVQIQRPNMTALQRIQYAKTPAEMGFLLGQAAAEIDDWLWGKAVVNYDDAMKGEDGYNPNNPVGIYYNIEVRRLLKKWIHLAEAFVKFADHFIDYRLLHSVTETARAEAAAKAAMLSRPGHITVTPQGDMGHEDVP